VKDFYFIDHLLNPTWDAFLFQLPPSFHFTVPRLKRILDQLDPSKRNVIEFAIAVGWEQASLSRIQKN